MAKSKVTASGDEVIGIDADVSGIVNKLKQIPKVLDTFVKSLQSFTMEITVAIDQASLTSVKKSLTDLQETAAKTQLKYKAPTVALAGIRKRLVGIGDAVAKTKLAYPEPTINFTKINEQLEKINSLVTAPKNLMLTLRYADFQENFRALKEKYFTPIYRLALRLDTRKITSQIQVLRDRWFKTPVRMSFGLNKKGMANFTKVAKDFDKAGEAKDRFVENVRQKFPILNKAFVKTFQILKIVNEQTKEFFRTNGVLLNGLAQSGKRIRNWSSATHNSLMNTFGGRNGGVLGALQNFGNNFRIFAFDFFIFGLALRNLVIQPLQLATTEFREFEQNMKNAQVLSGASVGEFLKVENAVTKLANSYRYSKVELSGLVDEFARAGLKTNSIEKALKVTVDLADAVGSFGNRAGNLKEAQNILLESFFAFRNQFLGLSEEIAFTEIANQITAGANESKASLEDFGYFMNQVAASASSMGIPLEEAIATFSTLKQVMGSGRMAASALNQTLVQLSTFSNETEYEGVVKSLEAIGLNADAINPKIVGLKAAIDNIYKIQPSEGLINKIFGTEGSRTAKILTTIPEEFERIKAGVIAYRTSLFSAVSAEKIAEKTRETANYTIERAISLYKSLLIEVGSGAAKTFVQYFEIIKYGIQYVTEWISVNKDTIVQVTKLLAVVMTFTTAMYALGIVVQGVTKLITMFSVAVNITTGALSFAVKSLLIIKNVTIQFAAFVGIMTNNAFIMKWVLALGGLSEALRVVDLRAKIASNSLGAFFKIAMLYSKKAFLQIAAFIGILTKTPVITKWVLASGGLSEALRVIDLRAKVASSSLVMFFKNAIFYSNVAYLKIMAFVGTLTKAASISGFSLLIKNVTLQFAAFIGVITNTTSITRWVLSLGGLDKVLRVAELQTRLFAASQTAANLISRIFNRSLQENVTILKVGLVTQLNASILALKKFVNPLFKLVSTLSIYNIRVQAATLYTKLFTFAKTRAGTVGLIFNRSLMVNIATLRSYTMAILAGTTATKVFSLTLKATGIGLVITALGTAVLWLVGAFDDLNESLDEAIDITPSAADQMATLSEQYSASTFAVNSYSESLKSRLVLEKELLDLNHSTVKLTPEQEERKVELEKKLSAGTTLEQEKENINRILAYYNEQISKARSEGKKTLEKFYFDQAAALQEQLANLTFIESANSGKLGPELEVKKIDILAQAYNRVNALTEKYNKEGGILSKPDIDAYKEAVGVIDNLGESFQNIPALRERYTDNIKGLEKFNNLRDSILNRRESEQAKFLAEKERLEKGLEAARKKKAEIEEANTAIGKNYDRFMNSDIYYDQETGKMAVHTATTAIADYEKALIGINSRLETQQVIVKSQLTNLFDNTNIKELIPELNAITSDMNLDQIQEIIGKLDVNSFVKLQETLLKTRETMDTLQKGESFARLDIAGVTEKMEKNYSDFNKEIEDSGVLLKDNVLNALDEASRRVEDINTKYDKQINQLKNIKAKTEAQLVIYKQQIDTFTKAGNTASAARVQAEYDNLKGKFEQMGDVLAGLDKQRNALLMGEIANIEKLLLEPLKRLAELTGGNVLQFTIDEIKRAGEEKIKVLEKERDAIIGVQKEYNDLNSLLTLTDEQRSRRDTLEDYLKKAAVSPDELNRAIQATQDVVELEIRNAVLDSEENKKNYLRDLDLKANYNDEAKKYERERIEAFQEYQAELKKLNTEQNLTPKERKEAEINIKQIYSNRIEAIDTEESKKVFNEEAETQKKFVEAFYSQKLQDIADAIEKAKARGASELILSRLEKQKDELEKQKDYWTKIVESGGKFERSMALASSYMKAISMEMKVQQNAQKVALQEALKLARAQYALKSINQQLGSNKISATDRKQLERQALLKSAEVSARQGMVGKAFDKAGMKLGPDHLAAIEGLSALKVRYDAMSATLTNSAREITATFSNALPSAFSTGVQSIDKFGQMFYTTLDGHLTKIETRITTSVDLIKTTFAGLANINVPSITSAVAASMPGTNVQPVAPMGNTVNNTTITVNTNADPKQVIAVIQKYVNANTTRGL